jgi:hypothetical protein
MEVSKFEERTKNALTHLGLCPWQVCWLPDSSIPIRGRTLPKKLLIEIFDLDEEDAWNTFVHEIVEIKLRSALRPYRVLVNKLIEGYQELADKEKDRFIEELNVVFEVALGSPPSS